MVSLALAALAVAAAALCAPLAEGATTKPQHTIYVSVGDNQYIVNWGEPLDSKATIEAAIDSYQKNMRVNRIFWRGQQDQQWLESFVFRPQHRTVYGWWEWLKHLNYQVGSNRIAVQAAHRRGMKIWSITGLFDWGSQASAGGIGILPYVCEHKLRAEHPEYAPVNKYETRTQGGPLEFCYPEARKVAVTELTDQVVRNGYDGLVLYTYVENMSLRYLDEFGFNEPIVEEFKRRHGVDIRTQLFDKGVWAKLRGEYVTQFLKELNQSLLRRGKKLGVYLNPNDTHLPAIWNTSAGKIITAGHIYMDWERWVKEGFVDELTLGPFGGDHADETLRQVLAVCRGTKTRVSQHKSKGDMAKPDAIRIIFAGQDEIEGGFDWEANAGWGPPIEKTTEQPLSNLKGNDVYAKRRVLWRLWKKRQAAPIEDLIAAAIDRDIFVRLLALRTLGVIKDPRGIPAVEKALLDAENSVRVEAVLALGENPGPNSLARILDAIWRENSTWQFNYVAVPIAVRKIVAAGRVASDDVETLLSKLRDPRPNNRRMAILVLQDSGNSVVPKVKDAVFRVLNEDADSHARELALGVISDNGATPEVINALIKALSDKMENVQIVAARHLANRASHAESVPELRTQALGSLETLFQKFGDGCERSDRDWGWRDVGNGLLLFGQQGEEALKAMMRQKKDRRLAELAWEVLYVRQLPDQFVFVTEEQDQEAHALRPVW